MTATETKARKIRVVADIKVVLDPPPYTVYEDYARSGETQQEYLLRKEKDLQRWANEFNEFLRDHRSRDAEQISIDREYQCVCSECGEPWEMASDDNGTSCACCGAPT